MKKVKCRVTGECGNEEDFYTDGKFFYKCQLVYEWYRKEEAKRVQIMDYITLELFNYKTTDVQPAWVNGKLSKLHKQYSYEEIWETIKSCKNDIEYVRTHKTFKSYKAAFLYIFAIIENSIPQVVKLLDEEERKTKTANQDQLENMATLMNTESKMGLKKKKRDISNLL